MSQKTFKPEDFSPIHHYPKVPDKEGWYISSWTTLKALHNGISDIYYSKASCNFWYWDGRKWCTDDSGKRYSIATIQDRDWFGLKENPNVLL